MTRLSSTLGLQACNLLAAALLGGYCLWAQPLRTLRWINYWHAILLAWNLCIIPFGYRLATGDHGAGV